MVETRPQYKHNKMPFKSNKRQWRLFLCTNFIRNFYVQNFSSMWLALLILTPSLSNKIQLGVGKVLGSFPTKLSFDIYTFLRSLRDINFILHEFIVAMSWSKWPSFLVWKVASTIHVQKYIIHARFQIK